ncbi:MAG: DUF3500 domain-containing protein [SAR202 cluster bacterium]|nr:DUF3500 domain-containing protein [SAR202 cluster bacterium]
MESAFICGRTAKRVTLEAKNFLASLDNSKLHKMATFPFEHYERTNWHYIPRARTGLPLSEMDNTQTRSAYTLLKASLGESCFTKAKAIMQHENILREIELSAGTLLLVRDPNLYYFSIFGTPGDGPWGWQVDGHHLSVNYTLVDDNIVSVTPSFLGSNPAEVKQGPHRGLRILREEEEYGRDLFAALDGTSQQRALIYPMAPSDILSRASVRAEIDYIKGMPATEMTKTQGDLLNRLISTYVGRMPKDIAKKCKQRLNNEAKSITFGWAGSIRHGQPHYYRIHSRSFLIEYDNTQNEANHIHTVWRDLENDFGLDPLKSHYEEAH